jgi:VanZ like family
MNTIKRIIIHPIFIYAIIFLLECISTETRIVYNEMPKEGDDFKSVTSDEIFCFLKNGKFRYNSEECYFSHGNPPYSAGYSEGGIKIVTTSIADKIPLMGSMCNDQKPTKTENIKLSFAEKYLKFSFFLGYFSNISHVLFYLVLAFSSVYHFSEQKNKYGLVFMLCFIGGGLLEVIQYYFVVGRSASIEDQVLNSIGILLGMFFFWFVKRRTSFFNK